MTNPFFRPCVIMFALGFGTLVPQGRADLTLLGQSVIDERGTTMAANAPYGRAINGESFQGQALTSLNGYQYAIYWATDAKIAPVPHVAVARRKLPDGAWQVIDLDDSKFKNGFAKGTQDPVDAHDTCSIGISPGDGAIHIAYDHHNHPLRYRVTAPGVATNPETATWDKTLFLAERSDLIDGQPVKLVSYPYFERTPSGGLQLFMRRGQSGKGSWWLYNYDSATHQWTGGWQYDDGTVGVYPDATPPTKARCAYPNAWTYGPDGKLHVTWVWREDFGKGLGGFANHDICYICSENGGTTWKNNAGTIVGDQTAATPALRHVTIDSPGLTVVPLQQTESIINTQAQAVDSKGRIHVMMYHLDPAKTVAGGPPKPWRIKECSYFHHWRDADGTWHESKIPAEVGGRPKLLFDQADNAYAVFTNDIGENTGNIYASDRKLVVAMATAAAKWDDWTIVHTENGPFVSEALADSARMKTDGILSVVMQDSPTRERQPTPLRVFDFKTAPSK